jgi:hypothetical protein
MALDEKDLKSSWFDHLGKVTFLAAVAGSLIMVVGQLFGTLFPIWLGPDLSDYDLVCDPIYHNILIKHDFNSSHGYVFASDVGSIFTTGVSCTYSGTSTISVHSLHRIYGYEREIYLNVKSLPGINVSLSDPIIQLGKPIYLNLNVNILYLLNNHAEYGSFWDNKYPIVIQGIGADGKERNCTVIIALGSANRDRDSITEWILSSPLS